MHVILTAFIVVFGFTSAQPNDQMGRTVNGEGSVQEIYRNYFDSLMKNKAMDTRTYHDRLAHESAKEQQDFDTMKGEIQSARQKNAARRNINSQHDGTDDTVAVLKREAAGCKAAASTTPAGQGADEGSPQDQYVRLYGNDVNTSGVWPLMNELKDNQTLLIKHCNKFFATHWPEKLLLAARKVWVEKNTLWFPGTAYQPIQSDFVMCKTGYMVTIIHKGLKSDCVFHVERVDPYRGPETYKLGVHLCGVIL